MNSKQLSIILGIVVVILFAVVGYMTFKDSSTTDSPSQQNASMDTNLKDANDASQTPQPAVATKQYSDQYVAFNYPNSWTVNVKTPKDPLPPEASYPCGVVWDKSIGCLFLGKNSNTQDSSYSLALAVFQSSQSALQWCQSNEFDLYDACQPLKNGDTSIVTAKTPDSSSPKYTYTILSQKGKVIVLMNVNASNADLLTVSESIKVK